MRLEAIFPFSMKVAAEVDTRNIETIGLTVPSRVIKVPGPVSKYSFIIIRVGAADLLGSTFGRR